MAQFETSTFEPFDPRDPSEGFASPEEEIAYLRERIRRKEKELDVEDDDFERARVTKRELVEYQDTPSNEVLTQGYQMPESEILQRTLRLEPEEHDQQVDELLRLIPERGVRNTLAIVAKAKSAHLEDDIHRALVRYVAEGLPIKGVKEGSELFKTLNMTLYEVSLPGRTLDADGREHLQDLEKLLASMEQFYAGMLSVVGSGSRRKRNVFSVEMAVQQGDEHAVFYVSVPRKKRELFEKHIISIFPNARIDEVRGDYNIFRYGGAHVAAYAQLERSSVYPLKEYSFFTHDPLNVMLSAFSKLQKHGEGAAIQIIIGDEKDKYNRQYKKVLDLLREGKDVATAIRHGMSPATEVMDSVVKTLGDTLFNRTSQEEHKPLDDLSVEMIRRKAQSRVVPVTIRLVASAQEEYRAEDILDNIISTFNQFEDAQGNALSFKRVRGGKLRTLLRAFSFRTMNTAHSIPLSLAELTAMYHLTASGVLTSRELKQSRAKQVAAPIEVSSDDATPSASAISPTTPQPHPPGQQGIILGTNTFGGTQTRVHFLPEDRLRHFYEIGQTGTGKTNLMKNMIIQDIKNGDGCSYIDPHGSDIEDILAAIPPERHQDVIYFDPAHIERPMALNIMEFDPQRPDQKTFVVNEIFSIFEKLFGDVPEALGPMFQQYFRNAAMLILEGMENGTATLGDIPRVLANDAFRRACLSRSQNPVVNQFWEEIAQKAGGEASLENIVPYITSKTDIFLGNELMRPIVMQEKSAFNFREMMDSRKIFLVNLSKGKLGDVNSELLGLIVVGKFLQAALSRVDNLQGDIPPFYLYIDEFQNFTTPSIITILSEARKYKLSLNVAHQFIAQLDEKIRDAVFGNVGTKCVFRVSNEDAEFLEKAFKPDFYAHDIAGLENFNAYVSLLVNGVPVRPFNMQTIPPEEYDRTQAAMLKRQSYEQYGRNREEVNREISERYARGTPEAQAPEAQRDRYSFPSL